MLMMRACGTVLRKSFVCSIRGRNRSSAYFSSPIHLAFASTLTNGFPTTRNPRLPPLFPAINRLLGGLGLGACQPRGGQFHRFQYFDVTGAAATFAAAPVTSKYWKRWNWPPRGWQAPRPNPPRRRFMARSEERRVGKECSLTC